MAVPNRDPSQSKYSEQYMENSSFDEDFGVSTREVLGYDDGGNALKRIAVNASGQLEMSIEADNVGIGGGTQYAEDTAHNSGDTGTMSLAVRNDTLAALAGADGDYAPLQVDADGALYTRKHKGGSVVDSGNSTTATLGIGAAFTGTGVDCSGYASVAATLYADVASATDGMKFQFSTDNSNWDDSYDFTMSAGETRRFQFPVTARYFRVFYTNGGTGQGAFRAQTILHTENILTSIHRVEDNVSTDRSATLVKSVIVAQTNGTGDFIPVQANAGGILKVGGSVDVDSSALPTGASTAANQSTIIGHVDGIETSLGTIDADTSTLAGAVAGTEMQVDVVGALPAGTNAIGNVGIVPRTSGGLDIFRSIDIDESEEQIKATAGQLFSISAFNTTAAPIYLKFYNATAASVTVGTTTPVLTFVVPANADSDGAGFIWNNDIGFAFDTAITVAATTGVADNDTGAPGANACIVNIGYK